MKKNNKARKLLAIIGIIILVGLYVMAFVFALTENPNSMRMFAVSIVATVIIPVFIYVINMFLKLGQDKREFSEEIAAGKFVPDTTGPEIPMAETPEQIAFQSETSEAEITAPEMPEQKNHVLETPETETAASEISEQKTTVSDTSDSKSDD